jgi:hypothetical protein
MPSTTAAGVAAAAADACREPDCWVERVTAERAAMLAEWWPSGERHAAAASVNKQEREKWTCGK